MMFDDEFEKNFEAMRWISYAIIAAVAVVVLSAVGFFVITIVKLLEFFGVIT